MTDCSKGTREKVKVGRCYKHGAAPIPQEGGYGEAKDIQQISGFSHGVGSCAPEQGACKLTLNVKNGVIQEALVETIGCSGMTQSAAMASEILPGCTIIEALNTDLVCDAINVAMREIFLQLVYGRTQTAFTKDGLEVGAGLDDLGAAAVSQIGSSYGSLKIGPRYLTIGDGYVTKLGLDKDKRIIGYEFVSIGKMMQEIRSGVPADTALCHATEVYGRFQEAESQIDPRED
ncbi:MAG: hypothetical protein HDR27_08590 [Lachnospiraceae bacterium]|nr:hypothetical protein [Lachnospiraceae bacterium]